MSGEKQYYAIIESSSDCDSNKYYAFGTITEIKEALLRQAQELFIPYKGWTLSEIEDEECTSFGDYRAISRKNVSVKKLLSVIPSYSVSIGSLENRVVHFFEAGHAALRSCILNVLGFLPDEEDEALTAETPYSRLVEILDELAEEL